MLIRPATEADIPALLRLAQHSATAAQWTLGQYHNLFSSTSPRRIALVIEQASHVQGFLVAQAIPPEWEIENIAIAPDARRRGLGTRLLGEFLDRARAEGAQAVFLEVRESNHAARSLYEKWAFVECGRRVRYFQNPQEDAIAYLYSFT
jgi:ribosomal-protein-alanine N-acetyltransferase